MRNVPKIKPVAVHAYFDKVQVWFCQPVDHKTQAWLEKKCGPGEIYAVEERARFDSRFRQRVELKQPSRHALDWLARQVDIHINYLEITLDYIFPTYAAMDDANDFLRRHLVRRWHGPKQLIRLSGESKGVVGQSRYDAARSAPNRYAFYTEEFSRVSGERFSLHFELRVNGASAVRSAGIKSAADLVNFDHRAFWARRLLLLDVDPERIGRALRNKAATKGKSRVATAFDDCTGQAIFNSYTAVQEMLAALRAMGVRSDRITTKLPIEDWLPPTHTTPLVIYEDELSTKPSIRK